MIKWEVFTERYFSDRKTVALSINSESKRERFYLGKITEPIIKFGDRVEILFDRETKSVGLRKVDKGVKVTRIAKSIFVYAEGFCEQFGLDGRFQASNYSIDGDIIVFPLKSVE